MILFWKMHNIAQTPHIWFTTPKRVNDTTLSQMWKFFSLLIALSTWMRREAIVWVRATSSGLICPLFPKKGGIFRETPRGRRSSIVNPLSAITESPFQMANSETLNVLRSLCQKCGQYSSMVGQLGPHCDANISRWCPIVWEPNPTPKGNDNIRSNPISIQTLT